MSPEELFDQFEAGFAARKFSAGLLIAFIDLFKKLNVPSLSVPDFNAVLEHFPRRETTAAGQRANTLIVALPDKRTLSLRGFYNEAERFFRSEHKRFDYPSCAPHATQAWNDYRAWLNALATFSVDALDELRTRVVVFVLNELASQAFDPSSVKVEPPIFQLLLDGFEMTARRGEPTGAAFQGIVFGFLRADNPHLQIEISKVRAGSRRLQRVGDIDGWEGARLAISVEVKQFDLGIEDMHDLEAFSNETGRRGSLGVVAALSFKLGVRDHLMGMGLRPLDHEDMSRIVELWDPLKQRTATASFIYYVTHVEKNSSLIKRLDDFVKQASINPPTAPS